MAIARAGLLRGTGEDQDGQWLWQSLQGHCALTGAAKLPLALHGRERKTKLQRVASGSQSFPPSEWENLVVVTGLEP